MGVVLIFLIVFGAFGWFVYKAYQFIAWNSGDESPEFHQVTRDVTFTAYWLRLMPLLAVGMAILALAFVLLSFQIKNQGIVPVLITLLSARVHGYGAWLFLLLEWRFWQLLDGVRVTYNPEDGSIKVEWFGRMVVVTPQNVERMELHLGDGKLMGGMGYLDLYLTDGQRVRLNWDSFYHHDFMKKYYRASPEQIYTYRGAWSFSCEVLSRVESE